jgi:tripartite-type tricarboxylate transporter receptor subunit TctC
MNTSKRTFMMASGSLLLTSLRPAWAQGSATDWPQRPIQLLIPYPPGGSTDLVARPLAAALQPRLGQPLVMDYKPGAGGSLASNLLARANPDGHTMIMVLAAHSINPSLYPKLPYDTRKDFAPVSLVANLPLVLAASSSFKGASVQDLIREAKAHPGKLTYASAGSGNTGHLAAEMFSAAAGIKLTHIPYKGSAPVVNAMLAGETDITFDTISTAMPHIRSGRLRALGMTGAKRSPMAPEIPTLQELGLPGGVVNGWYAVMAPAGTPAPIRERMSREIAAVVAQKDFRAQLEAHGYELVGSTPAELNAHIEREMERWAKVIKAANIKLD